MTIAWPACSGRPPENRSSAAGPAVSKTALLSAPTSADVGVAAGQDHAGAPGASPAGCLEPDAGAAAGHDDDLPGQFRLALAGSDYHDSSYIR